MGPMSRDERIMLATMAFAVVLWVTGDAIGVSSVVAAMLGKLARLCFWKYFVKLIRLICASRTGGF